MAATIYVEIESGVFTGPVHRPGLLRRRLRTSPQGESD